MKIRFYEAFRRLAGYLTILLVSFLLSNTKAFAADGAKLFKQNCAVCHSLGKNKLTGPGLEGVMSRVPSEDWLKKWIKNNKALIKSGDAYAVKLLADNANAEMTVFEFLGDDEISAIIETIKKGPPQEVAPTTTTTGGAPVAAQEPGLNTTYVLLGLVIFFIVLIAVLRGVKRSLQNVVNAKKGEAEVPERSFWADTKNWMSNNKRLVALGIIIVMLWLSKLGWDGLMSIGVFEGYHPEQPIKFSHKIHAGDNQINCQYCHNTVEKSKTAGIPTVNVCMNCHKGISKGPTTGTTEIAKIYEAAGWDPDKGAYTKPQQPIKWVKVHNLPDFVWFSHQQHVNVGKQDCANCHGEVKDMTTVQQVKPLTMGWCIDCHRKTEVPGMAVVNKETGTVANAYYEDLHKKLVEKFKNSSDKKITVDKMGGIECAKCHY